jgi:AraC-like DNA-binding protein
VNRGGVELASGPPCAELRGQVRAYTGYAEHADKPVARRELPTGDVAVVIGLGSPLRIRDPRTGSVIERSSFVAGVHDSYVLTETSGQQLGIEIRLTPTGAYRLFGVAMWTLANHAVAFEDVIGRDAELLAERLAALEDWKDRFALLDSQLARLLRGGPFPSPSVIWAWRRLVETSGRVAIGSIAGELGCTRKHLAERFREQVGVPPKTLARVLRFDGAMRALRNVHGSLAEIAAACGYYDQAHFSRELRELGGSTPLELRAVTSVQDEQRQAV